MQGSQVFCIAQKYGQAHVRPVVLSYFQSWKHLDTASLFLKVWIPYYCVISPSLEIIVPIALKAEQQLPEIHTRPYLLTAASHSSLSLTSGSYRGCPIEETLIKPYRSGSASAEQQRSKPSCTNRCLYFYFCHCDCICTRTFSRTEILK